MARFPHVALVLGAALALGAGLAACPSLDGFTGGPGPGQPDATDSEGGADGGGDSAGGDGAEDATADVAAVSLANTPGTNLGGFAVDEGYIYWSLSPPQSGNDAIARCSLEGCAQPELIADAGLYRSERSPVVAASAGLVYYAVPASFLSDGGLATPGSIWRIESDGGSPTLITSGDINATQLVVDGNALYWSNYGVVCGPMSCPLTGCASPTILAQLSACDGDHEVTGIALDVSSVFFTVAGGTSTPGAVLRCPRSGCTGAPFQIALAGGASPYTIGVDSTRVYWANASDTTTGKPGEVLSSDKDGNGVKTLASNQGSPYVLALDEANVFWTDFDRGLVLGVAKGGGALNVLAIGQTSPSWIVTDARRVYWLTDHDVMARAK